MVAPTIPLMPPALAWHTRCWHQTVLDATPGPTIGCPRLLLVMRNDTSRDDGNAD
jgi:hypothetical protein